MSSDIVQVRSITQLPHVHLSAIADYLPQLSRGLLAVALTAPSASFHTTDGWNCERELSNAGKAIISKTTLPHQIISLDRSSVEGKKRMEEIQKARSRWEIIDSSDTDDLAGKLSDDDIGALLVSTKATKKLRVLNASKLMKCPIKDFKLELNQLRINVVKCDLCEDYRPEYEPSLCDLACFKCSSCLCDYCNHETLENIEKCDNCGFLLCYACDYFEKCTHCDSKYCSKCAEDDDVDAAFSCGRGEHCDDLKTCFKCYPRRLYGCGDCLAIHTKKLVAKNEKLIDENEQLRNKVEELSLGLGV